MGRFTDLLLLMVVVFGAFIVQFAGAAVLDPLGDELIESGIPGDDSEHYNAEENFNDIQATITKWIPWTVVGGSTVLVAWREYRRQRITARRPPGP